MEEYIEKTMERLNSGESNTISKNISSIVEEKFGRRRKQEKVSCISELFKVLQEAILLILFYKTMSLFRATSSSTFIMSEVQSKMHSIINSGLIF